MKIARCYGCGCKFRYRDDDIQHETKRREYIKDYILCPSCGNRIYIVF